MGREAGWGGGGGGGGGVEHTPMQAWAGKWQVVWTHSQTPRNTPHMNCRNAPPLAHSALSVPAGHQEGGVVSPAWPSCGGRGACQRAAGQPEACQGRPRERTAAVQRPRGVVHISEGAVDQDARLALLEEKGT